VLIVTILFVSSGRNTIIPAAVVIGGMVTLEIFLGAGISGASFNPVRSLPPAIVFSYLENIWIYLTAPFIGAILGFLAFKTIHKGKYV
jgi:aquaporin Z